MHKIIALLTISLLFASCNHTVSNEFEECIKEKNKIEANKKMVVEFYQELLGNKNLDVINQYIKEDYIQHNPMAADGREALKEVFSRWFKDAKPEKIDFRHIIAEDDLVVLHIKGKLGNKPVAIMDIFRIEDGKIAEHWDIIQEIPEKSANDHPMF